MHDISHLLDELQGELEALEKLRQNKITTERETYPTLKKVLTVFAIALITILLVIVILLVADLLHPLAGFVTIVFAIPLWIAAVATRLALNFLGRGRRSQNYLRRQFKERIIHRIIAGINPEFHYEPYGEIALARVDHSALFPDLSLCSGEDRITGVIGNVKVEICEILIKGRKSNSKAFSGQGSSGSSFSWYTMFRGLFMIAEFPKDFRGAVMVVPRGERAAKVKRHVRLGERHVAVEEQNVEDAGFHRAFSVFSTHRQLSFYLLTPAFITRILELRQKLGVEIHLSLINGNLYLAVDWRYDLFEINPRRPLPKVEELGYYVEEISWFYKLVEDLDLQTRIWGRRAIEDFDEDKRDATDDETVDPTRGPK